FYSAPGREAPAEQGPAFIKRLLSTVYEEPAEKLADLRAAGFRILPEDEPLLDWWQEDSLPSWTKPYVWTKGLAARQVRYLLTFRPFGRLPPAVRQAYLAGELHLLPFPGSLTFL